MLKLFCLIYFFSGFFYSALPQNKLEKAEQALKKGIEFYHSIAINGGYVYSYSVDMKEKWGEGRTDNWTIEVQEPGTPAVGMSFLQAYLATKDSVYLTYAEEAALALVKGQNKFGGWNHKIHFANPEEDQVVSFDDNQTQGAIRFLMAFDQLKENNAVKGGIEKALSMMLKSQLPLGGWPHKYPKQNNYHDYATFNDGGINDCIKVMIDAYNYYRMPEYLASIKKAARYIDISQLPPPQPAWGMQYNQFLQPVWARTFEPPCVSPIVTIRNINSLLNIYLVVQDENILNPIPDAVNWLRKVQLPNGKYCRFLELGTNKPMYYDRGRIRVASVDQLSEERRTGYGYEMDLRDSIDQTVKKYKEILKLGPKKYIDKVNEPRSIDEKDKLLKKLEPIVDKIIAVQDSLGRWITKHDKFKDKKYDGELWKGKYSLENRINSLVFNQNIAVLNKYIELQKDKIK